MAIYQQDPFATAEIEALRKSLSDSERKRWELQDRVSKLNSQIERITGLGPEYVRHLQDELRAKVKESKRSLKDSEEHYRSQVEEFEARIRRELDRYLAAKKMAEAVDGAVALAALKTKLPDEVLNIIRNAIEDDNPFVLEPNVHGFGVNIRKLIPWLRAKIRKFRSEGDNSQSH